MFGDFALHVQTVASYAAGDFPGFTVAGRHWQVFLRESPRFFHGEAWLKEVCAENKARTLLLNVYSEI